MERTRHKLPDVPPVMHRSGAFTLMGVACGAVWAAAQVEPGQRSLLACTTAQNRSCCERRRAARTQSMTYLFAGAGLHELRSMSRCLSRYIRRSSQSSLAERVRAWGRTHVSPATRQPLVAMMLPISARHFLHASAPGGGFVPGMLSGRKQRSPECSSLH